MKEFEKKGSPSREGFSKFLPASMSDSGTRRRLTEYEIQVQDLQAYVRSLEAETVHLRKKLEDSPKEFMVLENKLREANRQLVQAFNQNEKLVNALYEAREQISSLKEEVDKLCAPPSTYGVYLPVNEDATVNILSQGRRVKVTLPPSTLRQDVARGVLVDREIHAVGRRRRAELVDLFLERRDLLPRLVEGVHQLLVLVEGLDELAVGFPQPGLEHHEFLPRGLGLLAQVH